MAAVAHADSKRKYSWWWDSHISPKNSKWLQENLTDMDVKVKQMIKLIEEDADSFARRAEMYYKKRPELMKLVEEFYRAYRALAERYDHATGALRQAHRTMAEAFPNQVPFALGDDSPAGTEADPRTPELAPARAIFYPDELQNDSLGLSSSHLLALKKNGAFTDDSDTVTSRRGLKQLNDFFGSGEKVTHGKFGEGRARKGLNFHDAEENEQLQHNESYDIKARVPSESERMGKAEMEILTFKNALANLEAEKEAGLLQYQQSLERLSNLESEVSRAREDSKGLSEQARIAEAEVQTLKEALARLETEREANIRQYQQCLDELSNMEKNISRAEADAVELSDRASKAEIESQTLKQDLARIEAEKEAAVVKYEECSKMISALEDKLLHSEEDSKRINEVADKAESEVERLKQALGKLTEEKEALALQYQQCLEAISILEHKLARAEEEAQRLHSELDNGFAKLNGAEEKCLLLERSNQTLHSELESMAQKMGSQSQELTEKQKELGRLWTCIQEERLRFVEAETAFQTLQHLHSQSQDELRSLAAELQNRAQILKDMGTRNQSLQEEVEKVKEENKGLNELNLSSAESIKNLQDEILSLRETIGKLEAEVELRVDQRNALQQEIYCLKEELNELNKKHQAMVEQVESVSLNPENFGLSVKELQDENSRLKEVCERDRCEKVALLEKLEIMEKLLEKNAVLENSLSDLNVELEGVRDKVKALEEACQNLLAEKSTLVAEKNSLFSQLQDVNKNLKKLSDENNFLVNSLFDANAEVEGLRAKSKSLEDSCLLLDNEKSCLITERVNLVSQLDIARKGLKDLEKSYAELEGRYLGLEEEKESTLQKVEELQFSLDAEKQQHASFVQLSETRLAGMESQISFLQEEGLCRKKAYEEELDKALDAQIEIFIMQKYIQDLKEKNFSLLFECQKLLQESSLSEKLIHKLENENCEQQEEMRSLVDQIKVLRVQLYQLLEILEIDADHGCETKMEQDQSHQTLLDQVTGKLKEMQISVLKALEQNHQVVIENSILVALLGQLKPEAENLATERNALAEEFRIQSEQFLVLQREFPKLTEINEELRVEVAERNHTEEVLKTEMRSLHMLLSELQGAQQSLQDQNCKVHDEKKSLMKKVLDLQEEKHSLEEENCVMFVETISQSNLSHIFKDVISEKLVKIADLSENLDKLGCINNELEEKVRLKDGKLEDVQMQNSLLKQSLEKSENELVAIGCVRDQLNCEIANGKDLLSRKEKELFVAEQMLCSLQNERTELHMKVEDMTCKYDEAKIIQEDQGKQILKLTEDYDCQIKETRCIHELNMKLEAELGKLLEELKGTRYREESLYHELEKERKHAGLWETQATELFSELQISSVCEVLLNEKAHELSRACENLEDRSNSNDIEINQLKEKANALECENEGLKAHLAASIPAVISLKDSIRSLENHTLLHKADNDEVKDPDLVSHMQAEGCQETSEDQIATVLDGFTDLQMRVKAIEKAIIEKESLAMLETLNANSKLEVAMRQIEELKCRSNSRRESGQTSKRVGRKYEHEEPHDGPSDNLKLQKRTPEISEERDEVMTKDIMLDQVSECSSHGLSRRGTMEADDQMLELWETADHGGSIDLKVAKSQKVARTPTDYQEVKAVKQQKSKNPTIESLVEKELGVDKLEISKRYSGSQKEGSKRKILERLDSDAQKLTNLQITVQDLKKKVETSEKGIKRKGIEYDTVKEQLEEAEEAIVKLLDVNRKLLTNIEDLSLSFDGKSATESDDSGSMRRRKVSEQARRVSEKIGRLQLEVQKLQFLLLRLDDEKESRGRTRITERKTRVLLRDYLYGYGGLRSNQKRKKAHFCACVQPPTRGD